MDYEVRVVTPGALVDATSRLRLPYEPRGWLLDFRRDLGAACGSLHAKPGEVLHAVYSSPDRSLVDIENALTYNLGNSAIRAAAVHGFVLERAYAGTAHHYRYALVPSTAAWTHWRPATHLATMDLDAPRALFTDSKASWWWLAARRGRIITHATSSEALSLRITVAPPVGWRSSLVELVKTLGDGLVSALHVHTGPLDPVLNRAAVVEPGLTAAEFESHLTDPTPAALGGVNLVVPRASGLQWLPGDERIVVLDARLDPDASPGHVHAEVHTVSPRPPEPRRTPR
jgi:hypothetical protein